MIPTPPINKKELLAKNFLLESLSDRDLEYLAGLSRMDSAKAGEQIFLKGDLATGMIVVVRGRVLIYSTSFEGKEIAFNVISPGEVFGEIALLDGGVRTADARALEDCAFLILERRNFVPFLERNPKLSIDLLMLLCQRLRHTTEQVEESAFLDLRARLARKLVAFADIYGVEGPVGVRIDMHLTQADLGAMLGTSRESINKQLRAWAGEDLLRIERTSITVLDLDRLTEIGEESPL